MVKKFIQVQVREKQQVLLVHHPPKEEQSLFVAKPRLRKLRKLFRQTDEPAFTAKHKVLKFTLQIEQVPKKMKTHIQVKWTEETKQNNENNMV